MDPPSVVGLQDMKEAVKTFGSVYLIFNPPSVVQYGTLFGQYPVHRAQWHTLFYVLLCKYPSLVFTVNKDPTGL